MIEARNLVKAFGKQIALDGLTLSVSPGDVLGLIGPNGAGKTTTLRILATLEEPDAGEVSIAGKDLARDVEELRRLIGFMPERFGLYDELSVEDYLDLFARIAGLGDAQRPRRIRDVIELCDLQNKAKDRCAALSKGVRQRLFLAKTLLGDPPVLLLDEPASGLDPRARVELRELLRELAQAGKAIIISSHILSELDAICNRAAVIESGRVRFSGSVADLADQAARLTIRLAFLDEAARASLREALGAEAAVEDLEDGDGCLRFAFAGERGEVPGLLARLVGAGHPVFSFEVESAGLESLFLQVTEGTVS